MPPVMQMSSDLETLKVKFSAVKQENIALRTQMQHLHAQLKKKNKEMRSVLELKEMHLVDKFGETHITDKIKSLRKEMMSIQTLTNKVRALEHSNTEQQDELKLLKSSLKYTLIKELQIEAQTYFLEARRMKKMLDRRVAAKRRADADAQSGGGGNGRGCSKCDEFDDVCAQLDHVRAQLAAERKRNQNAGTRSTKKKSSKQLRAQSSQQRSPSSRESQSSSAAIVDVDGVMLPQHVKVELQVGARSLPGGVHVGPLVVLFERDTQSGRFSYVDQTELVQGNAFPNFLKRFLIAHRTTDDIDLKLNVYDHDGSGQADDRNRIGSVVFSLNSVITRPNTKHIFAMTHQRADRFDALQECQSTVWVQATEVVPLTTEQLALERE